MPRKAIAGYWVGDVAGNVEVVRRAFENFNRRDLAAAADAFAPDAEWVPYLAALEEEVYRGRDEIERMWREVLGDLPDFQIELVEVVAEAADTVVIKVDFLGMGRASGADIRTTVYQAASFCDGQVSVQGFRTAGEALEVVGRSE
jgi:ketosteroid isomerase-like protein